MEYKHMTIGFDNSDYFKKTFFNDIHTLNSYDISTMFSVDKEKARDIVQRIKSVSDIAGIDEVVTVTDYLYWFYQKFVEKGIYDFLSNRFCKPNSSFKEDKQS